MLVIKLSNKKNKYTMPTVNYVSEDDCLKVINKFDKKKYKFVNFRVNLISNEPLGFLAEHFKLEISVESGNKNHTLHFFVKTIPSGIQAHIDYVKHTGVFKKEALLYQNLFDKLQSLTKVKFSPTCFIANPNSHIILEDLSLKGFSVIKDKSKTFDFAHAKCATETVARFHAACIIFEEQNSSKNKLFRIYDHYKDMLFETTFSFEEGHPRNDWRITTMTTLVNLCKKMEKFKNKDCETNLRKLEEEMKIFLLPSTKYRNVLNHCDLWSNNIMFSYEQNLIPKECVIVDLQMIRYVPPCYDFLLLLYLTTTKHFQEQHFEELINIYYNIFTEELMYHNIDPKNILSKQEFLESCTIYKRSSLLEAAMFGTIVYLNYNFSKDMLSSNDTFYDFMQKDRSKLVCKLFDDDEIFRNRMESVLDQLLMCIL